MFDPRGYTMRLIMTGQKFHSREEGQSLVELALMLVFLLILLAGVVDLGRMMFEYLAMRDAAQEGAGYASIYPNYCAEIENRVMQNLPDANYAVTIFVNGTESCMGATNACVDNEIKVVIDHTYETIMPLFAGIAVPMHVEIKDRIIRPPC